MRLWNQCWSANRHWSETRTQGGKLELELSCSGCTPFWPLGDIYPALFSSLNLLISDRRSWLVYRSIRMGCTACITVIRASTPSHKSIVYPIYCAATTSEQVSFLHFAQPHRWIMYVLCNGYTHYVMLLFRYNWQETRWSRFCVQVWLSRDWGRTLNPAGRKEHHSYENVCKGVSPNQWLKVPTFLTSRMKLWLTY